MLNLLHSPVVSCVQSILEVLRDFLLVELLLNAVDDGHDALDVFVEQVTLLQALISDHALVVSILLASGWVLVD